MTTISRVAPAPIATSSPLADASATYEALAPSYDRLTAGYRHDLWLDRVQQLAVRHGLHGRRLLDLGCGTGKSFLPMLERGYEVTGCDFSPSMLTFARQKAPSVRLHQADLRTLPLFGEFDLITALDDPLNYLVTEDELHAAFIGIEANLATAGLLVFDLNTLSQYREQFAHDTTIDDGDVFIAWRGDRANISAQAGATVKATVEVFPQPGGGCWERCSSVHTQRHWPRDTVEQLACSAGLRVLSANGQRSGGRFDEDLDELVHPKAIYVACRQKGATMDVGTLP